MPVRLSVMNPRNQSNEPDEYENTEYDDYCNHLVALGPGFLSKVLCQPECARRQLLASNAVTAKSSFMDLVSVVTSHEPLIYPADRYENTPNHLATLPEIEQPGVGWKQHWFGDRPVDQVMRATNPDLFPDRTIGFFPGWTWGYAIRS